MNEVPAITRVVETGIYVEDLDHSVTFYKDLFEFETEVRDELICVLHVPGGQALILFPKRVASEPGRTSTPGALFRGTIPPHGGNGRQHIALAIPLWNCPRGSAGSLTARSTSKVAPNGHAAARASTSEIPMIISSSS